MSEIKKCHACGEEFDSGNFKWSIFWSVLPIAIFFIVLFYKMRVIGKNN